MIQRRKNSLHNVNFTEETKLSKMIRAPYHMHIIEVLSEVEESAFVCLNDSIDIYLRRLIVTSMGFQSLFIPRPP